LKVKNYQELLPLLGMARKGNSIIIGFDNIKSRVGKNRKLLVILSEEFSDSVFKTLKYYESVDKCKLLELVGCDRKCLSDSLGLINVQVIGIDLNTGLSKGILQLSAQGGDAIE